VVSSDLDGGGGTGHRRSPPRTALSR